MADCLRAIHAFSGSDVIDVVWQMLTADDGDVGATAEIRPTLLSRREQLIFGSPLRCRL